MCFPTININININQGLDLFERMSKTKVRMDRVVYNTVIACCSQLKLWRRGVSRTGILPGSSDDANGPRVEELGAATRGAIYSPPLAVSAAEAVPAFRRPLVARRVHARYIRLRAAPRLACHAQVALLDEMREHGINPDQYSYNSAIYGCVKAQQAQQMTMVLARMR